jgi:hypothetical protein
MQELTDSIKRPSLRIMGIEEGEEVQAKRMHNIFNKIIMKISQIERNLCPYRCKRTEDSRTPNRPYKNRTTPWHIIIKTTNTEIRERILKVIREKKQITYKVNPSKSQQTSEQKH